jgi:hypothetical protein
MAGARVWLPENERKIQLEEESPTELKVTPLLTLHCQLLTFREWIRNLEGKLNKRPKPKNVGAEFPRR